jgi:hypothetical protein
MEPLNSNDVVFSLNFINGAEGVFIIDEPVNFDGLNFVLEQGDRRYGRDVSFAGGDFDLRFDSKSNQNNSALPLLLTYNTTYGFESNVQFIVTVYGVDYVIGLLDFQRAVTDGITYFDCSVIQETNQALLKRRSDIKIDMFSGVDLDGNAITPLSTQPMFLPGTVLAQQSQWFSTNDKSDSAFGNITWNHINAIQQSEIENTLSFAVVFNADPETLRYIEAENDLFDVVLDIADFTINQNDFSFTELVYRIGTDFSAASEITLVNFSNNDIFDYDASFPLPNIARGETLWVYFRSITGVDLPSFTADAGATITITTNATPISTVTPSFTVQDVIEQVVLSTTGMSTVFSTAFNTATIEERVFNGLGLRGFDPDNFYVSFDDIKSWFEEVNADFQIEDNTTVYIGLYADFYTDFQVGSNTTAPNVDFKRTYNPRYTINKMDYNYGKFENEKNTENNRALNAIHTESQWNPPNLQVENKKEIEIGFIRDFALIETVRRFNSQADNTEATKNDQDIFIVNTVGGAPSPTNTYNFNSFVSVDPGTGFITFTNNNDFSFIATGITVASIITFDADDGTYTASASVINVTATAVELNDFGASGIVSGQYLVNFSFTAFGFTARTDQDFATITNDGANGAGFVNMAFSPKRNILNYWGAYLNTAASFVSDDIKNTFFIGNPDLETDYNNDSFGLIREGDDIALADLPDRILTPYIIETVILVDFTEFQAIVANLRAERGFLRVADNNGNEIDIYPQLLDYNWEQNALRVIGEERF